MLPLPPLPPGTSVDGLVVEELVDAGGQGSVFRARSPSSGMLFALKFIPLSRGWEWVKRELVNTLHLEHKNLVSLVGSGFWPPALPEFFFLKMEYVKGRHLDVWAWEENPDAWTIAGKVLGVARGLAVAHAQDVVHRDVKEANILVRDSDGEPVVLDFGAARREPQTTLTEGLFPPGTPLYRSPEAWRFGLENERKVRVHYRPGKADDLYAVGVVLYRLLTGRYPFVLTEDEESVRAVIDKPPLPPSIVNPRVPRTLGEVCMRLLEKRPEDRYPGTVALCEVLEELMARADDSWRVPLRDSRPPPVRRLALQVPRRAVVRVGLLMGLALAGGGLMSWCTHPTSQGTFRQEMAASRPSPEAGQAAAPPQVVSTPAAVASPATRPKDNAVVKKKQKTPSPEKDKQPKENNSALPMWCFGAAAMLNTACAGAQVRPPPEPEDCPPGAVKTMTDTLGIALWQTNTNMSIIGFLPFNVHPGPVAVREGAVSVVKKGTWGKLPTLSTLKGRLFVTEGRVLGRFTEARTPGGETYPVCMELWEAGKRGVEIMEPGPGPDSAIIFSSADVMAVDRFE